MGMRHSNRFLIWLLLACGCSDVDVDRIGKVSGKAWGRARGVVNAADSKVRSGLTASQRPAAPDRPVNVADDVVSRTDERLKADWALKGANINVSKSPKG